MQARAKSSIVKPKTLLSLVSLITKVEPFFITKASKHCKWGEAMIEEYRSLLTNDTWELVSPPSGHNIVGCKWDYKIKYRLDGNIQRCKARIVV